MIDKPTILLKQETEADYQAVEHITREAFWNLHVPGCNEHYLAHVLRNSPDFIPKLDYVAWIDGKIVGNIMFAHSHVIDPSGIKHPVLTFGPVSVLPQLQSKGIGKALINHTLQIATDMGYENVVIYGDPDYYSRFGFIAGESYGLRTSDGLFSPALQVKELIPNAMQGISGCFHEAEVYHLDDIAADEFEQGFPPKEKFETPSQKRFMELLSQSHP